MPTNTRLGGVFMTDTDGNLGNGTLISSENVCGLIFDTKIVGGIAKALGEGEEILKAFGSGEANSNVVEVNSLSDAEDIGIDDTVMKGLPYYHIKQFFTLAGSNQRLFISFMDSSTGKDPKFEAVEKMQLASGGIIYQIGVWTGEAVASSTTDETTGNYTIDVENSVISKLQTQAEVLGGKVGVTNYEGNSPVSIIVTAPVVGAATVDYTKLPDLTTLDLQKVSVLIGQAATDSVHTIQSALNSAVEDAPGYCIVGAIGAMLGCLAIAPADESIAHVRNFNLSQVMTTAELGFGDTANGAYNNIKTLGYTKRNTKIHQKGYIFLTNYDGIENGVFFSSDQTLSTGDYRLISRCRVMHKSRRVVRLSLLPFVNESMRVDSTTGYISSTDAATITNTMQTALDSNMVQPGTTISQICGREVTLDTEQDILSNDQLLVSYAIVPKGLASAIFVTEGFSSTASA